MQPRSPRVAGGGGGGQQDPRAHPNDHINRTHGSSRAGDVTFIAGNLGLWIALAAAFRKSLRGPGAVLGVQAVVAMDLVRALRHCFWKLAIGQTLFKADVAAFVALFNFAGSSAYCLLARRAAPRLSARAAAAAAGVGAALFTLGSVVETGSELHRQAWKRRNPGKLCDAGLWQHARSVNYTGYVCWRWGMAVSTGNPWALILPSWHAYDFSQRAIPMLETYLANKYGSEWDAHVRRVPHRILPGLW